MSHALHLARRPEFDRTGVQKESRAVQFGQPDLMGTLQSREGHPTRRRSPKDENETEIPYEKIIPGMYTRNDYGRRPDVPQRRGPGHSMHRNQRREVPDAAASGRR